MDSNADNTRENEYGVFAQRIEQLESEPGYYRHRVPGYTKAIETILHLLSSNETLCFQVFDFLNKFQGFHIVQICEVLQVLQKCYLEVKSFHGEVAQLLTTCKDGFLEEDGSLSVDICVLIDLVKDILEMHQDMGTNRQLNWSHDVRQLIQLYRTIKKTAVIINDRFESPEVTFSADSHSYVVEFKKCFALLKPRLLKAKGEQILTATEQIILADAVENRSVYQASRSRLSAWLALLKMPCISNDFAFLVKEMDTTFFDNHQDCETDKWQICESSLVFVVAKALKSCVKGRTRDSPEQEMASALETVELLGIEKLTHWLGPSFSTDQVQERITLVLRRIKCLGQFPYVTVKALLSGSLSNEDLEIMLSVAPCTDSRLSSADNITLSFVELCGQVISRSPEFRDSREAALDVLRFWKNFKQVNSKLGWSTLALSSFVQIVQTQCAVASTNTLEELQEPFAMFCYPSSERSEVELDKIKVKKFLSILSEFPSEILSQLHEVANVLVTVTKPLKFAWKDIEAKCLAIAVCALFTEAVNIVNSLQSVRDKMIGENTERHEQEGHFMLSRVLQIAVENMSWISHVESHDDARNMLELIILSLELNTGFLQDTGLTTNYIVLSRIGQEINYLLRAIGPCLPVNELRPIVSIVLQMAGNDDARLACLCSVAKAALQNAVIRNKVEVCKQFLHCLSDVHSTEHIQNYAAVLTLPLDYSNLLLLLNIFSSNLMLLNFLPAHLVMYNMNNIQGDINDHFHFLVEITSRFTEIPKESLQCILRLDKLLATVATLPLSEEPYNTLISILSGLISVGTYDPHLEFFVLNVMAGSLVNCNRADEILSMYYHVRPLIKAAKEYATCTYGDAPKQQLRYLELAPGIGSPVNVSYYLWCEWLKWATHGLNTFMLFPGSLRQIIALMKQFLERRKQDELQLPVESLMAVAVGNLLVDVTVNDNLERLQSAHNFMMKVLDIPGILDALSMIPNVRVGITEVSDGPIMMKDGRRHNAIQVVLQRQFAGEAVSDKALEVYKWIAALPRSSEKLYVYLSCIFADLCESSGNIEMLLERLERFRNLFEMIPPWSLHQTLPHVIESYRQQIDDSEREYFIIKQIDCEMSGTNERGFQQALSLLHIQELLVRGWKAFDSLPEKQAFVQRVYKILAIVSAEILLCYAKRDIKEEKIFLNCVHSLFFQTEITPEDVAVSIELCLPTYQKDLALLRRMKDNDPSSVSESTVSCIEKGQRPNECNSNGADGDGIPHVVQLTKSATKEISESVSCQSECSQSNLGAYHDIQLRDELEQECRHLPDPTSQAIAPESLQRNNTCSSDYSQERTSINDQQDTVRSNCRESIPFTVQSAGRESGKEELDAAMNSRNDSLENEGSSKDATKKELQRLEPLQIAQEIVGHLRRIYGPGPDIKDPAKRVWLLLFRGMVVTDDEHKDTFPEMLGNLFFQMVNNNMNTCSGFRNIETLEDSITAAFDLLSDISEPSILMEWLLFPWFFCIHCSNVIRKAWGWKSNANMTTLDERVRCNKKVVKLLKEQKNVYGYGICFVTGSNPNALSVVSNVLSRNHCCEMTLKLLELCSKKPLAAAVCYDITSRWQAAHEVYELINFLTQETYDEPQLTLLLALSRLPERSARELIAIWDQVQANCEVQQRDFLLHHLQTWRASMEASSIPAEVMDAWLLILSLFDEIKIRDVEVITNLKYSHMELLTPGSSIVSQCLFTAKVTKLVAKLVIDNTTSLSVSKDAQKELKMYFTLARLLNEFLTVAKSLAKAEDEDSIKVRKLAQEACYELCASFKQGQDLYDKYSTEESTSNDVPGGRSVTTDEFNSHRSSPPPSSRKRQHKKYIMKKMYETHRHYLKLIFFEMFGSSQTFAENVSPPHETYVLGKQDIFASVLILLQRWMASIYPQRPVMAGYVREIINMTSRRYSKSTSDGVSSVTSPLCGPNATLTPPSASGEGPDQTYSTTRELCESPSLPGVLDPLPALPTVPNSQPFSNDVTDSEPTDVRLPTEERECLLSTSSIGIADPICDPEPCTSSSYDVPGVCPDPTCIPRPGSSVSSAPSGSTRTVHVDNRFSNGDTLLCRSTCLADETSSTKVYCRTPKRSREKRGYYVVEDDLQKVQEYIYGLDNNVRAIARLQNSGYNRHSKDCDLWYSPMLQISRIITRKQDSSQQNIAVYFRRLWSEWKDILREIEIPSIEVDGQDIARENLFGEHCSLNEMEKQLAVVLEITSDHSTAFVRDRRERLITREREYRRKVEIARSGTSQENDSDVQHKKEEDTEAVDHGKQFTIMWSNRFFDCVKLCSDKIPGCYAPNGFHSHKPVQCALCVDSRILAVFRGTKTHREEIENVEVKLLEAGMFVYALHSSGHEYVTDELWAAFYTMLLESELVPRIILSAESPAYEWVKLSGVKIGEEENSKFEPQYLESIIPESENCYDFDPLCYEGLYIFLTAENVNIFQFEDLKEPQNTKESTASARKLTKQVISELKEELISTFGENDGETLRKRLAGVVHQACTEIIYRRHEGSLDFMEMIGTTIDIDRLTARIKTQKDKKWFTEIVARLIQCNIEDNFDGV